MAWPSDVYEIWRTQGDGTHVLCATLGEQDYALTVTGTEQVYEGCSVYKITWGTLNILGNLTVTRTETLVS